MMIEKILNDKSIIPNDDVIFPILGEAELLWKQTFSYLFDNNKNISVNWLYSDCGKYWVCVVQKKKNTIFRLRIYQINSFSLAFPFGDKAEPLILQSNLPDKIINEFIQAKKYNSTRYISVDVKDSRDFENVKKLIDIKINT
jgi:hypothetical protein